MVGTVVIQLRAVGKMNSRSYCALDATGPHPTRVDPAQWSFVGGGQQDGTSLTSRPVAAGRSAGGARRRAGNPTLRAGRGPRVGSRPTTYRPSRRPSPTRSFSSIADR